MYSGDTHENDLPQLTGTVHERIHQLESLVISLMRHDAAVSVSPGDISISDPPNGTLRIDYHGFEGYGLESPQTPRASAILATEVRESANTSSMPLGGGYMKYNNTGTANYVGGSHWAAVLDSISELKGNFAQEEIHNTATNINPHNRVYPSSPWLLYGYQRATRAEILSSIPTRRAADRLVSRYLTLDIPAGKSTILKSKLVK